MDNHNHHRRPATLVPSHDQHLNSQSVPNRPRHSPISVHDDLNHQQQEEQQQQQKGIPSVDPPETPNSTRTTTPSHNHHLNPSGDENHQVNTPNSFTSTVPLSTPPIAPLPPPLTTTPPPAAATAASSKLTTTKTVQAIPVQPLDYSPSPTDPFLSSHHQERSSIPPSVLQRNQQEPALHTESFQPTHPSDNLFAASSPVAPDLDLQDHNVVVDDDDDQQHHIDIHLIISSPTDDPAHDVLLPDIPRLTDLHVPALDPFDPLNPFDVDLVNTMHLFPHIPCPHEHSASASILPDPGYPDVHENGIYDHTAITFSPQRNPFSDQPAYEDGSKNIKLENRSSVSPDLSEYYHGMTPSSRFDVESRIPSSPCTGRSRPRSPIVNGCGLDLQILTHHVHEQDIDRSVEIPADQAASSLHSQAQEPSSSAEEACDVKSFMDCLPALQAQPDEPPCVMVRLDADGNAVDKLLGSPAHSPPSTDNSSQLKFTNNLNTLSVSSTTRIPRDSDALGVRPTVSATHVTYPDLNQFDPPAPTTATTEQLSDMLTPNTSTREESPQDTNRIAHADAQATKSKSVAVPSLTNVNTDSTASSIRKAHKVGSVEESSVEMLETTKWNAAVSGHTDISSKPSRKRNRDGTAPETFPTGQSPVDGTLYQKTTTTGSVPSLAPIPLTLAEKRRLESERFPNDKLVSLAGTTSAEVRRMSGEERELVLYKRKLRNRESARRSRQKRQTTINDLQDEVDELTMATVRVLDVGLSLKEENDSLRKRLDIAQAELRVLRNAVAASASATEHRGLEVISGRPPLRPTVPAETSKLGG